MDDVLSSVYDDAMGFVECQEKCPKCGAPFHYKKDQGIPFCWECIVSNETARRGRELLARLKKKLGEEESGSKIDYSFFL